jgi:hypothetical protein
MKRARSLWVVFSVLGLGVAAPGCQLYRPDPSRGNVCAARTDGQAQGVCVPADQGPAAAWNQAVGDGRGPVQMWATWPNNLTLDSLVRDRNALGAWLSDANAVLSFTSTQNAESYRATLGGKLADLLNQVRDRQAQLLAQPGVDAIGHFKAALSDKAKAERDPLVAEAAAGKQSMAAVQAIFDKAKSDAAPLSAAYAALVTQFQAYRATEAAETSAYAAFAQQASAASAAELPGIEQAVLAASKDASAKAASVSMSAMKLAAQLQMFQAAQQAAIQPYAAFMATHGAALPDMTSDALRSVSAVQGYAQLRATRSDATATSLLHGMVMREKALSLLAPPPPPAGAQAARTMGAALGKAPLPAREAP